MAALLQGGASTKGAGTRDDNPEAPYEQLPNASKPVEPTADHAPGEYAALVNKAKEEFKCGNLFEAVVRSVPLPVARWRPDSTAPRTQWPCGSRGARTSGG
jgi:anthranilate synthase